MCFGSTEQKSENLPELVSNKRLFKQCGYFQQSIPKENQSKLFVGETMFCTVKKLFGEKDLGKVKSRGKSNRD